MVQVINTIPQDTARRQLFLPLQFLTQHGGNADQMFAGKETPQIRAAVDQLLEEARSHLRTALSLLPTVPLEVRPAFLPLALAARDVKRMSRADSDPFALRPTPRVRMLWTLWRASRAPEFKGGD